MTIQEIITRKEGQTFDCKSIQIDPKALAVPIVAFANADGGVIAIGVSDETRKIEGVDQYTEKLNELLRVPFDFCNPSVPVTCSYLPCTDKDGNENRILLMEIPASSSLHTNQADEAFMRVGDKSRKLTFDERMQLMYEKGNATTKIRLCMGQPSMTLTWMLLPTMPSWSVMGKAPSNTYERTMVL